MQIKLSKRLSAIADMVSKDAIVADIGTDHGYLPAHLLMSGISSNAIATDINEAPLAQAAHLVTLLAIGKKIDLRLGDGLTILKPGEVDTIVIAGIGATAIINILERSPLVLAKIKRLILQPMRHPSRIRSWLMEHGWEIKNEELVYEEEIYYEIIMAEPGLSQLTAEELEGGPILLKRKHPLLKEYLNEKINVLKSISRSLQQSSSLQGEEQKRKFKEKLNTLERVVRCL